MKKLLRIFLLTIVISLCEQNSYARKDTSRQSRKNDSINQKNDFINVAIFQQYNKKQNEIEQLRITDSITKVDQED